MVVKLSLRHDRIVEFVSCEKESWERMVVMCVAKKKKEK